MKLNKAQFGLLAEVVKDLGFAVFGLFGLPSITKIVAATPLDLADGGMLAMGMVLFLVLNGMALAMVADDEEPEEADVVEAAEAEEPPLNN